MSRLSKGGLIQLHDTFFCTYFNKGTLSGKNKTFHIRESFCCFKHAAKLKFFTYCFSNKEYNKKLYNFSGFPKNDVNLVKLVFRLYILKVIVKVFITYSKKRLKS